MSTIVVSDTSPIRVLEHLGLLSLLEQLADEVLVPPAVAVELETPRSRMKPIPVVSMPMLRIQAPNDRERVRQLAAVLDQGESEALALAIELNASVLIDEAAGRAEAKRLGLVRIGVLGLLARAKTRGLIGEIAPLIDRLRREINFHVSAAVRDEALRLAGEK